MAKDYSALDDDFFDELEGLKKADDEDDDEELPVEKSKKLYAERDRKKAKGPIPVTFEKTTKKKKAAPVEEEEEEVEEEEVEEEEVEEDEMDEEEEEEPTMASRETPRRGLPPTAAPSRPISPKVPAQKQRSAPQPQNPDKFAAYSFPKRYGVINTQTQAAYAEEEDPMQLLLALVVDLMNTVEQIRESL